jgi:hypothetical protein
MRESRTSGSMRGRWKRTMKWDSGTGRRRKLTETDYPNLRHRASALLYPSFRPLVSTPRYAIAPGQRFAVRVTILDADGIRSRSHMADLIREEYAAPSIAHPANQYPDREGGDQATVLAEQATLSQLTAHPQETQMPLDVTRISEIPNLAAYQSAAVEADDTYRMMTGRSPASP